MNCFQINLNKLEDKSKVLRQLNKEIAGLVILALLFIVATGIVGSQYQRLLKKSKAFDNVITNLNSQIKDIEKGENYIDEDDVMDLYDLTSQRIFWTEKFEALADIVDTTIALTSITYQNEKLFLQGISRVNDKSNGFSTISAFIDSLKTSPVFSQDFDRIEFSSSERIHFMNRDIINFEILCLKNKN